MRELKEDVILLKGGRHEGVIITRSEGSISKGIPPYYGIRFYNKKTKQMETDHYVLEADLKTPSSETYYSGGGWVGVAHHPVKHDLELVKN